MQVLGEMEVGDIRQIVPMYGKAESHYLPVGLYRYFIPLVTVIGHILRLTIYYQGFYRLAMANTAKWNPKSEFS